LPLPAGTSTTSAQIHHLATQFLLNDGRPHLGSVQKHIDKLNQLQNIKSTYPPYVLTGATNMYSTAHISPSGPAPSAPAMTSKRDRSRSASEPGRQKIVAPSKKSGGVPDPTADYIAASLLPSMKTENLRDILVIIDLNGTLLFRPNRANPTSYVERPFAPHFIHYVLCNFKVMIWSSAKPENVSAMCRTLFTDAQRRKLVEEWSRKHMGLSPADYVQRVQCYKRLQTVWKDSKIQRAHGGLQFPGKFDQTNTILIDDSAEKARSEPFNILQIPEFDGQKEDPDTLRKVAEYLDLLKFQTNVSSYMRVDPFRLENITVSAGTNQS
jgi:hypothetical protein